MTEPYRCGKCGGDIFTVFTSIGEQEKSVAVICQLNRCGYAVNDLSLTTAFQKISEKPTLSEADREGTAL